MTINRLKTILLILTLILIPALALAEPLMPMRVGDVLKYKRTDDNGASWTVNLKVLQEVERGSNTYFRYVAATFSQTQFDDIYGRSTENTVYVWDEEEGKEEILFQTGEPGFSWTRGETVTTILNTGSMVTTPYGGPFESILYRVRRDEDRYSDVYVAPGLGILKIVDNWTANSPIVSELVETNVLSPVPEFGPDSAVITNRYSPLKTGDKTTMTGYGEFRNRTYTLEVGGEEIVAGVNCIRAESRDTVDGELVDNHRGWAAQDVEGNVWILKLQDLLTGEVNEVDANMIRPVLFMPAEPEVGQIFFEVGPYNEVVETGVTSPVLPSGAGPYENCIKIVSRHGPTDIDTHWYAPGIGEVLEDHRDTDQEQPRGYELTELQWGSSDGVTRIEGSVVSDDTGKGIDGAVVRLAPGGYRFVTDADGAFSGANIPPGTYTAEISASHYQTRTGMEVSATPGVVSMLNATLSPQGPEVADGAATPGDVYNDGNTPTLLTIRVTHPDGPANIASVAADLSEIGGSASQTMVDDGSNGDAVSGDGIYSYMARARSQAPVRLHVLTVTAADTRGFTATGVISLHVLQRASAIVLSSQSQDYYFNNTLARQTLRISITLTNPRIAATRADDNCYVELTIYRPDGSVHSFYHMTDSIDVTIPEAEQGTWRYTTENHCDTPVNYQIETRGSGSGMISGRVTDAYTGKGVEGAEVTCDTGGSTRTLAQGYYIGVVSAGVGAVRVIRDGYQVHVKTNVAIAAGQTISLNHDLKPEEADPLPAPEGRNSREIFTPSDEPDPATQPAAARISDDALEINVLFAPRLDPVDQYVGLAIDYPGLSGALFFFNRDGAPVPLAGALPPWRSAVTGEQSAQLLPPVPLAALPVADYTLYALTTPDSATLADYDLIFFTFTLGQAPPSGRNTLTIDAPGDAPDPVNQPMAAREIDGSLEISVYFPPQREPATIYLTRQGPGPSGKRYILNVDDQWIDYPDALLPWREDVTKKQVGIVYSAPLAEMEPGEYTFSSMVTTDPDQLSNYNRIVFSKMIGQPR